jgi:hypothetical protein
MMQPQKLAVRMGGKKCPEGNPLASVRKRHLAKMGVLLASVLGGFTLPTLAANGPTPPSMAPFDIHGEPSPADWRYFIRSNEKDREKLWVTHSLRGVRLGDWSWGWRLGWVRTCGPSDREYCRDILQTALFDRALVVRAEAATRLGRRLEGSGDQRAVDLMARSYRESRNLRHGRPLFIQHRILFAIHRIGGAYAADIGQQLARDHRETKTFWQKLVANQG